MDDEILWPPQGKKDEPQSLNDDQVEIKPQAEEKIGISSDAPMVSLAEAVKISSKSRNTIRRWITDGKIEGAIKTENGWKIPIPSLVSSGAWDGVSAPEEDTKVEETNRVSELEAELLRARFELNSEKKLREAAERNADDLRFAMRMLTTGTSASTSPQQIPSVEKRPVQHQRPQGDRWEFTPEAILKAANKFRRKLLG